MLGAVIQKVKAAGKSVSVVEHCRMPEVVQEEIAAARRALEARSR